MKLIGIDLYQHLFGKALRKARLEKEGDTLVDDWIPELHLELGGCLPEEWIPETEVRLALYARLARLDGVAALDQFEAELDDRFGAMPDQARRLLQVARIRTLARAADIRRIDAGPAAIALTPHDRRTAKPVGDLVEKNGRWIAGESIADPIERANRIEELLDGVVE